VAASDRTSIDNVRVTWDAAPGATHYQVYRAESESGIKAAADSSGSRASDFSAPRIGRRALPPLTRPSGVVASDRTWIDKVRVNWEAVAGATHYQVWRAESESGIKTAMTLWRVMDTYDDTTATAGRTYYYWVQASADGSGGRASDFSAPATGRRASGAVNPATGVSATDGAFCGLVRVSWNQVAGAAKYQVYRASSATGTKTAISPWQTANSYDDATATPGSVYHYWVRASIDGGDEGSSEFSLSDTGYVGMVPLAPTGVAASDGTFINAVFTNVQHAPSAVIWQQLTETYLSRGAVIPFGAVKVLSENRQPIGWGDSFLTVHVLHPHRGDLLRHRRCGDG
jgi:hypothetical protein